MSLIQNSIGAQRIAAASVRKFSNVTFPRGFNKFLSALSIEQLVADDSYRAKVNEGYVWGDHVAAGGISLTTTKHPYLEQNFAGDVTVVGDKRALELVEMIFNNHRVLRETVDVGDVKLNIRYHAVLNPSIWDGTDIKSDVLDKFQVVADEFIEFLKVPAVVIEDITVTGSAANYNWTSMSDVDLHIVVDMKQAKAEYGSIIEEYFDAKKRVWNETHHIKLGSRPVELYVQNKNEKHHSTGVYSIMNGEWVITPTHKEPSYDDEAVKSKAADLMNQIEDAVSSNKADVFERLADKIKKMRQAGLEEAGEFSTNNLVFKTLRNNGYLDKLMTSRTNQYDRELSVEEEELGHWPQP